jgi:hypothetical protein
MKIKLFHKYMTTMLELRTVKYFFDGKKYYKKINNHTLKNISKREFYDEFGNIYVSRLPSFIKPFVLIFSNNSG